MSDWHPDHDQALCQHHAAGWSYSQIAAAINGKFGTSYSRNAAIGRGARKGLRRPKKSHAEAAMKAPSRKIKPKVVAGPIRIEPPPRMVREEAEIRCAAIEPRHLTLLDLEPHDCRYPFGDSPEPITFCGHPKQDGSSYCPAHQVLSTRPLHPNLGRERPDFAAAVMRNGRGSLRTKLGSISNREELAS